MNISEKFRCLVKPQTGAPGREREGEREREREREREGGQEDSHLVNLV